MVAAATASLKEKKKKSQQNHHGGGEMIEVQGFPCYFCAKAKLSNPRSRPLYHTKPSYTSAPSNHHRERIVIYFCRSSRDALNIGGIVKERRRRRKWKLGFEALSEMSFKRRLRKRNFISQKCIHFVLPCQTNRRRNEETMDLVVMLHKFRHNKNVKTAGDRFLARETSNGDGNSTDDERYTTDMTKWPRSYMYLSNHQIDYGVSPSVMNKCNGISQR